MKRLIPALALLALAGPALARPVHSVGAVTWHPKQYVGKVVAMRGYLLRHDKGYILFSDEPRGAVSQHDLPVEGPGFESIKPMHRYLIEGKFVKGGLKASNGSPYHLVLTAPPQEVKR
ncbi:MAG: hypothetical protein KGI94_01305 [Paracoccaceae bacterium]|nr:hypothetical protein [Paracoccaceae bacterium]MDE3121270.1 hypothetical protein [Paracoccaceae bacterium]MDE3239838.1 hypothetical protein [Paracoccaceae bacterium]